MEHLQTIARKVTQNQNLKCKSVKNALHCIAEKAKGENIKCGSINDALSCIAAHTENLIGGDLKYHLYAWDYANGTAIAYSEKEVPVAGDVVFLKENMEGGKITDTNQLKLVYHVISDADGVITVSEHPEGQTGGYTFNRNDADDYEEIVIDVRDVVDIAANGLLVSQKGTTFKSVNVNAGVKKLYCFGNDLQVVYTTKENPAVGDACYAGDYGETDSNIRKHEVTEVTNTYIKANTAFSTVELPRNAAKDIEF